MPMTEDELAAIEARANAATPGLWNWVWRMLDLAEPDMMFIERARADVPVLVAEVRRLRAWLVEVRPGPYDGPYLDEIQELIDGALAGDPAPERTSP